MTELDYRFSSDCRLKKPADFKNVFEDPIKSTDRYFTLLATPNSMGHPRIGLAIAKKIIKKAVHRNVIKRMVRESFRLEQESISDIDIVVLVRNDAVEATVEVLKKSLANHWLKLTAKCALS